ncbi:hypothetical protein H4R18_001299 [Coemansia javaensis]|uniref:Beige protein homolog 1 n=1 Tax=Coemansia javaensis TaxID=2761396 RepID=A0A9W8HL50_9FUNG|nr:hypothetical protein H4R18_001299 [Coemansia javaensis]
MSAPGPSDCADCQRVAGAAQDSGPAGIATRELLGQLRAGSWCIGNEDSWQLAVAFLRQSGFAPGLDGGGGGAPCPALPSQATIVAASVLGAAVRRWTGDGGAPAGRLLVVLQAIAWLGGNGANRRVLMHHDAAAHVGELLAAVRRAGGDVFAHSAAAAARSQGDGLTTPDIRRCEWWRASAGARDAAAAAWAAAQPGARPPPPPPPPRADMAAEHALAQHALLLCERLFDPGRQFAAFLAEGRAAAGPAPGPAQHGGAPPEPAARMLSDILRIWRRLETAPPRAHFSPAAVGVCSAVAALALSGAVGARRLQELDVVGQIVHVMGRLDADEAYVAWRLAALLQERLRDLPPRSPAVQHKIDGLWAQMAARPAEYLRGYVPFAALEDAAPPRRAPDPAQGGLDALFAPRDGRSADEWYAVLRRNARPQSAGPDGAIEPAALQSCLPAAADPFPGTRLRRAMDTVLACAAQHTGQRSLPAAVLASLQSVHIAFISSSSVHHRRGAGDAGPDDAGPGDAGPGDAGPGDAGLGDACMAEDVVLFEYARFLLRLWQMPLGRRAMAAVFCNVGAGAWDRLLRRLLEPTAGRWRPHQAPGLAAHAAAMAGWLVARSAPGSGADGGSPMLAPPAYKLVFSRLAQAAAAAPAAHRGPPQWAPALGAAQGLAFVCWSDIHWFRQLLHETQCACDLLSAACQLQWALARLDPEEPPAPVAQSIGDFSMVSLPGDSAPGIAAVPGRGPGPRQEGERLLGTVMFLLHESTLAPGAESSVLRTVLQLCRAQVQLRPGLPEAVGCMAALRELAASSRVPAVADLSAELATGILQWLLVGALDRSAAEAGGARDDDARGRLALAREWSAFAAQWIVPRDLGTDQAAQQHARFLARYRRGLAGAALAVGTPRGCRDIGAMAVADGALRGALDVVQHATAIDLRPGPAGDGDNDNDNDNDSDDGSGTGAGLALLTGEALKLVAFLVHSAGEHTATLRRMGGYRTIHECAVQAARRAGAHSTPIAEGVLALLSGAMDPTGCHSWQGLAPDRHWFPTLAEVYADLPLAGCVSVLRFLAHWCEECSRARWWLSQSTVARQAIERLQSLLPDLAAAAAIQPAARRDCMATYMRCLQQVLVAAMGTSTCAADLRLVTRTLASGPGAPAALDPPEAAEHVLAARRMLSSVLARCMRAEPGQAHFDFGGGPGALCMPCFRRVPEGGFTLTAWLRSDGSAQRDQSQHLLSARSFSTLSLSPAPGARDTRHLDLALPLLLLASRADEPQPELGTVMHLTAGAAAGLVVSYNGGARRVEVEVATGGAQHRVKCRDGLVGPGRWHSLAICYAPTKRGWSPFGSSNVHVYVDGAQAYKGSLPYIDHAAYRACYIGGSPPPAADAGDAHGTAVVSPFAGRISGVRMFDGVLSTSEIELLHHLGPTHTSQLRRRQAQDPAVRASTLLQVSAGPLAASLATSLPRDLVALFQSSGLDARLLLCPDPSAVHGASCLDLSPIGICQTIARENARCSEVGPPRTTAALGTGADSRRPRDAPAVETPGHARMLDEAAQPWRLYGDALAVTPVTIHQLLHCLGGVESLFVFLYRLDWIGPATPPAVEGPLGSEERAFDQRLLRHAPLPSFLYLLRDLLRGSPGHLASITALNLVPLAARILRQRHDIASHLTMATLRAMQALQTALDAQGGSLPSAYPDTSRLWNQVQRELILNLQIWRRASVDTQLQYLAEVQRVLCLGRVGDEQGQRCNASAGICGRDAGSGSLGVRWILYSLFNYYPYDASQHVTQQQHHLRQARWRARSLSTRAESPAGGGPATDERSADSTVRAGTEPPGIAAASGPSGPAGAAYGLGEIGGDDAGVDMPGFPSLLRSETKQLRRPLLRTLELFLTASDEQWGGGGGGGGSGAQMPRVTKTDVLHVVRHLLYACNRDTEHTREILLLLFRCLADGSPNASGLASKFLGQRGLDVLAHLVECDDDSMAAEALNIVVLLLTMAASTREHESAASRITSSLRGRAPVAVDAGHVARILALVRAKRALTPALYRSLLLLALRDHAALLASINIDPAPGAAVRGLPGRRVRHIRNLSVPQSPGSSVYLADDAAVDVEGSFVASLPSRLVRDAEAWSAILGLAWAPATDPAMRVAVLRDLRRLFEDEPANYDGIDGAQLLDCLVAAVVLGGDLADGESGPDVAPAPSPSAAYAKSMSHLELVPHTTLDRRMQSQAVGHMRAREAWVQRRTAQLRGSPPAAAGGRCAEGDDALLAEQAQSELMALTSEWVHEAIMQIQLLAGHSFLGTPEQASSVHQAVVALWALTPTGSVPLVVRLLSRILSQARALLHQHYQLHHHHHHKSRSQQHHAAGPRETQAGEWALPQNLSRFASFALDMLLNYRQFQEYVACHHDELRALSDSTAAATAVLAAGAPGAEHDVVYHSQHSPWDDMPALARDLAELMLELGAPGASPRPAVCSQALRLVVSGIRSMHLSQMDESLRFLVRLLERHPSLADGAAASPCRGHCAVEQHMYSVLGYVHEAFMFADEQPEPGDPGPDNEPTSPSVRESIGQQYASVFQCYRGRLCSAFPQQLADLGAPGDSGASTEPLGQDQFMRFVRGAAWLDLYRSRFMPEMRHMEEAEMQSTAASLADFAATLRELLVRSQRSEARLVRQTKEAQTSIASSTLPIEAEETSSVQADEQARPYGQWAPVWRQRLHALTAPRGPWRSGAQGVDPVCPGSQQWTVDVSENSQRMRRRLVRGVLCDDHRIAAQRRDRTGKRPPDRGQQQAGAHGLYGDGDMPHLSLSVSGADPTDMHRLDGEEEWNLVTAEDLGVVVAAAAGLEAAHFGVPAERIALLGSVYGRVEMTQALLRFTVERGADGAARLRGLDSATGGGGGGGGGGDSAAPSGPAGGEQGASAGSIPQAMYAELSRDLTWPLADIRQVRFRRFMMQSSAVEVFFRDRSSVLLNVPNKKALVQLVWKLASLPAANAGLALSEIRPPPTLLRRLGPTELWQRGDLSNFDYLMALNTIAGRSYNDLSQYPVFPWVIRDYSSRWLDLGDPKTFRDLSRPIGALNEKRLRHFIERYESFEDPSGRIKKFLYGTHYSSAASVAHYLIRTEPFASVHISLQSGKFDHADRQFHSISETWNSCMTGSGDVKELIPEFFYMPEFLVNHNGLDLGVKQNGTRLGDVELPPWASTPEEFVRINHQALESEHVSANLHKWIDLIFGFKQRGPEAIKAHNVFYYLTYEGAVNIDAIQDPMERASIESQIHYFGQTPAQLFTAPHPARHVRALRPRYAPLTTPTGRVQQFVLQVSCHDVVFVGSPRCAGGQRRHPPAAPASWPEAPDRSPSGVPHLPGTAEPGPGARQQPLSAEAITAVDAAGRVHVYSITLSAGAGDKLQLAIEPLAEGYYALAAASPPSCSQHLAHADRRPVSYAVVPHSAELLVSCAHLDGTARCTRVCGGHEGPAAEALPQGLPLGGAAGPSRGIGMTNAYASAVVGAMVGGQADAGGQGAPEAPAALRSLAGLFGGAESKRRQSAGRSDADKAGGPVAPAPGVFIPLAARLLEAANESSCAYLPDQQSCVAVSSDGTRAVAGSAQGAVAVLAFDGGLDPSAAAVPAPPDSDPALAGVGLPLLFAAGLADPMNTSLGHTSMAAYGGGGPQDAAGKWAVRHVLCGHDAAVLDVAIDTDHDIVASASSDGTVILWTERTGQYLRTLVPAFGGADGCGDVVPPLPGPRGRHSRVERVLLSADALVVCYSVSSPAGAPGSRGWLDPARALGQSAATMARGPAGGEAAALHVFGINGRHLRTRKLAHHIRDMALTRDGQYGACVSADSRVAIFSTHTLGVVRQFELPARGCSVVWSGASEQQLVVGCEGGRVVVISADAPPERS